MRLFGLQVPARLPEVIDRVGAVVEEPRFVPTFSGRKNLSLLARSIGVPRSSVDSVLQQVGLTDRARDDYKGYSLGMKQRLAIAAALLKSPDLLILDEPTNGLDPAGIRSIRELIRDLGESGVTVLLSSHILAEVQQVCHSVSIVGDGRLLASGKVEDLLGENVSRTRVGVADPQGAKHFLESAGYAVTRESDHLVVEGHEQPGADHPAAGREGRLRPGADRHPPDARVLLPQAHRTFRREAGRARAGRPTPTSPTDRRGAVMMRLLAVELNRFRSRRAIALLGLAAVVVAVVLVGATAWNTRPLTQADRADAAAQAELEGQKPELQQQVRACRADPQDYLGPERDRRRLRRRRWCPSAESYYPREPLHLRQRC